MTRRNIRWAGVICVALLIAISVQPFRVHAIRNLSHWHSTLHVLWFGLAAFLFLMLSQSRSREWAVAATFVCLGAAIEAVQTKLYHQRFEWKDLCADTLGVLIAFMAIQIIRKRKFFRRASALET
jgi:glycopeptide antibiotics resistance protein